MSRAEGGVHIHGNPHITCSPLNMVSVAENIAIGLIKADPAGEAHYRKGLAELIAECDMRLFGEELVTLLGGKALRTMAGQGTLIPFLKKHRYRGTPLIECLGGWMKKMMPLRGAPIVTYHKNWTYFARLFGLEEAGTIEPNPGIPPSPRHVTELTALMRERGIKIVLAANYFDEQKVRTVAGSVGAEPVIVPLYVGGAPGVDDYFGLVDHWTDELVKAAHEAGMIPKEEGQPKPGRRGMEGSDV
jgi:ABC-type Zn uptake system ZnuABC Zn-binding protein ZnuA